MAESLVTQEDILKELKQYKPSKTLSYDRDSLGGRYRIQVGQQLPEFGSQFAIACSVTDSQGVAGAKPLYALIYHNHVPIRKKNIDVLTELRHPNMVSLLESGIVEISTLNEARFVVILEKPTGKTISDLLADGGNPVSPTVIVNYVLRPMVEILRKMNSLGISHNRINMKNVYLENNTVLLGECVSELSGFSQDFVFEPIERILALPFAKADYAIGADCYSLAVLTLHMILGFKPFANIEKDAFIESMLTKGSYHTLAIQWDFSSEMQDFFRGLLNDSRRERWDPASIESWLSGRQFNLILPSLPNEATRSYDFLNQPYFNRKAIANAIYRQWPQAYLPLSDTKLGRWLETSAHKVELGDVVLRLTGSISTDNVNFERPNSELIARIIIMLDPMGPIRIRNLSTTIEGIGALLTTAVLSGNQADINGIIHILEIDLPSFASEQLVAAGGVEPTQALAKLQKIRGVIRIKGLGFGIERVVYDANPELPCQSKLIKRFHATSLQDVLLALDESAPQKAAGSDFIDRHIASFIASKLDLSKEISVGELSSVRKLSSHSGIVALKLLVRAQIKAGNLPLYGLCHWVAAQLLPITDFIHKRSTRDMAKNKLLDAASTGSLSQIADLLLDPAIFVNDNKDFEQTIASYASRKQLIKEYKNNSIVSRHSLVWGRASAQIISYGISLLVTYYTLKYYLHF